MGRLGEGVHLLEVDLASGPVTFHGANLGADSP